MLRVYRAMDLGLKARIFNRFDVKIPQTFENRDAKPLNPRKPAKALKLGS